MDETIDLADFAADDRSWQDQLRRSEKGALLPSAGNVALILAHDTAWRGRLAWCEFSGRVVLRQAPPWGAAGAEWSDADTARLRIWVEREYLCAPTADSADTAVQAVAEAQRWHPVREYLRGLHWDGVPRLSTWLSDFCGAGQTDYTAIVGTKWLIGLIARVMAPGAKNDAVLILEGPQGLGKSEALRVLSAGWFSDAPLVLGDKDTSQLLPGCWIVELAELDALSKVESTRAKAFFTQQEDHYRPSYGRRVVRVPRQCVFAGTTNQHEYLRDLTGNRRYWPVRVLEVNSEALAGAREQLHAEALVRYDAGERWWPEPAEYPLFTAQQEARAIVDPWEELIARWVEMSGQFGRDQFTGAELLSGPLEIPIWKMDRAARSRLGEVMSRLGWRRKDMGSHLTGDMRRPYMRPPRGKLL